MTTEEVIIGLSKMGLNREEITKFHADHNIERISKIVEAAVTPDSAFRAINAFYPDFEIEELQKQCDFVVTQVEESFCKQKIRSLMDLSEEELKNISGVWRYSVKNWFKENWRKTILGAVVVAGNPLFNTAF